MRRTKSGAIHKHDLSIQHQQGQPVDARQVLARHLRSTLAMMEVWGKPWEGIEAATVRAAIKNYLKRMERP